MQTWGSEGDIRPFLALGGALGKAGHDVELVITELDERDYLHFGALLGIRIRMVASPVLASPAERERAGEALLAIGSVFRQGRYIARRLFEPSVPVMFAAAEELAASCDLLVRHFFHYPAAVAAAKAGIPDVSVSFSPDAIPSATQPPADLPDLGRVANRLLWRLANFALDRTFLPPVNALRRRHGLPALRHATDAWYSPTRNLLAMSPALRPPADDWDERHRVCGFLNLPDAAAADPLPGWLPDFLDEGAAPVFVGFGSLTPKEGAHRRDTLEIIEGAVRIAGCRAIVQDLGEPGTRHGDILHVGRLPHADVFKRCAAVVHHAGAGTTQTALASGVPSVAIPHLADQFYWSRQLYRLGVAGKPLTRSRLTSRTLAARIASVLSSPALHDRARALGTEMSREDGCARAVSFIAQVART